MQNLTNVKFVKEDFYNALIELIIDGAYAVTTFISKILNMPTIAANYIQTRKAQEAVEVKKNIIKAYKEQEKQAEWMDTYLRKRNEMRTAEVQKIVGKEIKKIMIDETKKMQEKEMMDREANVQLTSINTTLNAQTNQALDAHDPRVPQTAMTSLAMSQGPLTTNMVDQINMETSNLTTALPLLPPPLPPPPTQPGVLRSTVGDFQRNLKMAYGPPEFSSSSLSTDV
ncbi:hypothetical protein HELRODRAFT_166362 [Helobdella robusta]|uniref:Uncharacterized protein n=1 Tax=Helobdella robusta TaxID=6412 RepID=T1EY20_HELRO|nr:hypothetical protein HELRODRAFT_166362 [Helobdella robusta]ESN90658.1 hypothetical protein HELRODRAFT_166362 [Helobdella robusta]